ncbi:hypothetical protein GLE_4443 [Lysobacter enzymogenes]|uniref:Uncharacterized protein n=1 Tax=Lysobacter enzymogenes TaxID=69 RepID=A0A0S2DNR6_LYSEN|nr:hypothetical protein GLE_4443 [Lysobacter enzymogenes]
MTTIGTENAGIQYTCLIAITIDQERHHETFEDFRDDALLRTR